MQPTQLANMMQAAVVLPTPTPPAITTIVTGTTLAIIAKNGVTIALDPLPTVTTTNAWNADTTAIVRVAILVPVIAVSLMVRV